MGLSTFDAFKHVRNSDECIEISGKRLHDLQHVLKSMLHDIICSCEEANVPFVLGGGSCLGAVRHGGFIPWDDDLDINMPHDKFDDFKKALNRLFPGKYWIHEPNFTPGYTLAFPRIRLKDTLLRSRDDKDTDECGVYIDIFFIENTPNSFILRKLHGLGSLGIGFAYSCRRAAENSELNLSLFEKNSSIYKTLKFKIFVGKLLSFMSAERWTTIWDEWNSMVKNVNSIYISIPVGRKHYFGELHPRSSFFPVKKVKFTDYEAPVPNDTNEYLTALYGPNYMIPPSEDQQEKHVVYEFDLGKYSDEK